MNVTESVVTCFIEHKGKILILKRSNKVKTYKGKWATVSGYIESVSEAPEERAMKEVKEETGLRSKDIKQIYKGTPIEIIDKKAGIKWLVHPYLLEIKSPSKIKMDWEHCDAKWINPKDLSDYKTVPKLKETFYSIKS